MNVYRDMAVSILGLATATFTSSSRANYLNDPAHPLNPQNSTYRLPPAMQVDVDSPPATSHPTAADTSPDPDPVATRWGAAGTAILSSAVILAFWRRRHHSF